GEAPSGQRRGIGVNPSEGPAFRSGEHPSPSKSRRPHKNPTAELEKKLHCECTAGIEYVARSALHPAEPTQWLQPTRSAAGSNIPSKASAAPCLPYWSGTFSASYSWRANAFTE